jgi:hypothetical protein
VLVLALLVLAVPVLLVLVLAGGGRCGRRGRRSAGLTARLSRGYGAARWDRMVTRRGP